ncbi:O-antigen polymerase [Virgibacillus halodenitrificans]|uniref:O-antigen polymerase n=1 Tax=Virgibacillus halodenitrificans TaxID=1482 RepID=UPI00045CCD6F|nr:O-antigen polymerase [Virgibacillus halodenitrificans]CDQ31408.1 hypothetical protein BN993_00785 [Virgibacillus halodenitrificans]
MFLIYFFMNIVYILFSYKLYNKKIFNPITIYSFVWVPVILLYELKLVYYYDLTVKTWTIIITFQLIYNFGCLLGRYITIKKEKTKNHRLINIRENNLEQRELKITIIILSLFTSVSTISDLLIAIKKYGFNLLQFTNQLYYDRLSGSIESGIPYLGAFVFPALILSGIYFKKFGSNKILLLPIILLVLGGLKSGGRLSFLVGTFMLLAPILISNFKREKKYNHVSKKKIQNLKIVISVSLIMFVLWKITESRTSWVTTNSYMSPVMVQLVEFNPSIYKIYTYLSNPIGVLNVFLTNPSFNFGGHTFSPIYNLLNKFGAQIPVNRYQEWLSTPISGNVGSYIRELTEDFTLPIAMLVTLFLGFILSYNYTQYLKYKNYLNLVWATTLLFVVFFSFFMWHLRMADTWIALLVGSISAYILDVRNKKRSMNRGVK